MIRSFSLKFFDLAGEQETYHENDLHNFIRVLILHDLFLSLPYFLIEFLDPVALFLQKVSHNIFKKSTELFMQLLKKRRPNTLSELIAIRDE